jgi:hypothetical protein
MGMLGTVIKAKMVQRSTGGGGFTTFMAVSSAGKSRRKARQMKEKLLKPLEKEGRLRKPGFLAKPSERAAYEKEEREAREREEKEKLEAEEKKRFGIEEAKPAAMSEEAKLKLSEDLEKVRVLKEEEQAKWLKGLSPAEQSEVAEILVKDEVSRIKDRVTNGFPLDETMKSLVKGEGKLKLLAEEKEAIEAALTIAVQKNAEYNALREMEKRGMPLSTIEKQTMQNYRFRRETAIWNYLLDMERRSVSGEVVASELGELYSRLGAEDRVIVDRCKQLGELSKKAASGKLSQQEMSELGRMRESPTSWEYKFCDSMIKLYKKT